jgi:hypothetical protein
VKDVENVKKSKKEGEGDAKHDEKKDGEGKKKDGEGGKEKFKEKKKCKSCGKDCADDGEKKRDGEKAKKDGEDSDKKSEEKKIDKSKEKSDNGGWTEAQDNKIKEMKAANKSWKDIASEVGASKNDVTKRFKELQKAGEDKSDDGGAAQGGDTTVEENNANGSDWDNAWGNGNGVDGGGMSFGDLFMDAPSKEPEKQNKNNNNNSDGNKKQKGNKGNKDDNGGGSQHQAGDEGWSYKSNQRSQQQNQDPCRLQVNDVWSKDDCEVLEILESQYREHKWLHIQAGFFNWTGRMITAELIECKFREDGVA